MISKFGFGLLTSWSELRCICCILYPTIAAQQRQKCTYVCQKSTGKSITCTHKSVSRLPAI